jgi:hypothetical protein
MLVSWFACAVIECACLYEHVLSGGIGGLQSDVGVHDKTVRSLQIRQVGLQKVDDL